MQKDYWNICKRNFRALGVIYIIIAVFLGLGIADSTNPESVRSALISGEVFIIIGCVMFFILAFLFKKRSKKAIPVAYVYLTIAAIFSIVNNFILSLPSEGIAYKIIGLLILAYLFQGVYKASKQSA